MDGGRRGELRALPRLRDRGGEDPIGPILTGFGSRAWLLDILHDPAHEDLYGERNDRMPAFGEEEILTTSELALIADWLREGWYRPVDGDGAR